MTLYTTTLTQRRYGRAAWEPCLDATAPMGELSTFSMFALSGDARFAD